MFPYRSGLRLVDEAEEDDREEQGRGEGEDENGRIFQPH